MKPWREVATPHSDVRKGTFQQAEFAADITAVHTGKAPDEYKDPVAFYERTFITSGMGLLLTQVAERLSGKGGEPVIQLQTGFGGGKTHTLLAVYHLATRKCPLSDLAGIPGLIERAGLMDVPAAKVAVIDGTLPSPGQPWKRGRQSIRTLWGDLAWQLGGSEGFALVKEADATGTSPGKEVIRDLLAAAAPCAVLLDELVVYFRQFSEGEKLSGGTYQSNLSFVQQLTEAAKLVPNAVVLVSLPESKTQAGGERGQQALTGLEAVFDRVQALWKPVATEEAFEIVRRRLFEPIADTKARDAVCRAFTDAYVAEGSKLPSETQEGRYFDRLTKAYPIHPEVFDRLYEDWSSIDGFQRTRGVLKLMAKVIYRLWKDDNKDLMILPAAVPLYDGNTRNALLYHLSPGWDPVIDKDIDGDTAETTELEQKEPRFGQVQAARRVARTLFLGTAPGSVATRPGVRGLDRARVLLGCLQPGQASGVYSDALDRLADRLYYLNSSGDKEKDTTRFWFDTRANLRREMEDRKRRFDDKTEVRKRIEDTLKRVFGNVSFFEGVHVFTGHADIPDDDALRLVILPPESWFNREEARLATDAVLTTLRSHGEQPRHRGNRLVFVAPDQAVLSRLRDAARVVLAWQSIVNDVTAERLVVDKPRERQAKQELEQALAAMPRIARECYKWLLCPVQDTPTAQKPTVEPFPLNPAAESVNKDLEKVCVENELVVTTWSPIHLRAKLKELYWTGGRTTAGAMTFWEDTLRYLYLPRLKSLNVLAQAIRSGTASHDFFGTAYGQKGETFEGFRLGDDSIQFDNTLLLIEPETARAYAAKTTEGSTVTTTETAHDTTGGGLKTGGKTGQTLFETTSGGDKGTTTAQKTTAYHGTADVTPSAAKMRLVEIAEEVIKALASDPNAVVRVTLEVSAEFPEGASDHIRRTVSENARNLRFKVSSWE